ncbi:MAG TPA: FlgD immunoglobulin-like domain containing protein [Gaiellaceae bacterium]|nr:FlgD immunoglobulin-like domain containing protein [Gaiellaceae bacterium]
MARLLSTLLVLGLLGGTAAAFAVTEHLKLQRSPIFRTDIAKTFSPVCGCWKEKARIRFQLRRADRLTLSIEDSDGRIIRTIVGGFDARRGKFGRYWDGRDDAGAVVPEGDYKPRVHLAHQHRTIVLPNPIRVDTTPPQVEVLGWIPRRHVLTPDRNFLHERLEVRYRLSEPGHVILYVGGKRRYRSRSQQTTGIARWFGRVNGRGVPAGRYRVTLAARDIAGNLSPQVRVGTLFVRYVRLPHRVYRVKAGTRFGTRVRTDSPGVRWRLGKRSGTGRSHLVLRAPKQPGRYRLTVRVGDHRATAVVVVEPRP